MAAASLIKTFLSGAGIMSDAYNLFAINLVRSYFANLHMAWALGIGCGPVARALLSNSNFPVS